MLPSHNPPSHTLPLDHLAWMTVDVLSCMTMAILSSPDYGLDVISSPDYILKWSEDIG